MNFENIYFQTITEKIIKCCEEVHAILGSELMDEIYCEALAHEFTLNHIQYIRKQTAGYTKNNYKCMTVDSKT